MFLFKKPWEISFWFLAIYSAAALLLMHNGIYIMPIWGIPIAIIILIAFRVFRVKKYKRYKLRNNIGELEKVYSKIYNMDEAEKNDFAISEEAIYYFEMVEQKKEVLTPNELSKYKRVLFGTEDPYIVTAEGKIIVKACPGDLGEETKSE